MMVAYLHPYQEGVLRMAKSLLDRIVAPITTRPDSKMAVELDKSGAVHVDVERFLSSEEGQQDLDRAQKLWNQSRLAQG
jgi:hypothetical protein